MSNLFSRDQISRKFLNNLLKDLKLKAIKNIKDLINDNFDKIHKENIKYIKYFIKDSINDYFDKINEEKVKSKNIKYIKYIINNYHDESNNIIFREYLDLRILKTKHDRILRIGSIVLEILNTKNKDHYFLILENKINDYHFLILETKNHHLLIPIIVILVLLIIVCLYMII